MPKSEGGLGLFDLTAWNKALLTKHFWSIQSKKDSLWVRWIHHFYKLQDGLWVLQPMPHYTVFIKKMLQIKDSMITHFGSASLAVT